MVLETRYAVGDGVLIGTGQHWLLLDSDPGVPLVDELWALLGQAGPVVDAVLEVLEKHFPEGVPSLALLDLTPGATGSATRGHGRLRHDGDERLLSISLIDEPAVRCLVGGVVAAGSARVREVAAPRGPARDPGDPAPGAAAATEATLIAGIPAHILAASAPDRVPDRAPDRVEHLDHDGHTTLRAPSVEEAPQGRLETPEERTVQKAPVRPHLRHPTSETVLAVSCPAGHVTAAYTPDCRVCHLPVPPQEPQRLSRPLLGVIELPSGEVVPLDRGVVFGRRPAAVPGGEPYPHLVHLPGDSTYLSRMHLQIELDGWLVMVRDLGSRSGTRLHVPGREPEWIRAHEAYALESGHALDLADVYRIGFEADA